MTIWVYELFAPEALIQYVAVFLIVVALAMPTLTLVRWTALVGGIVGVAVAAFFAEDRAGLVWWSLLTVVVLVRIVLRDPRGMFSRFNAEQTLFWKRVVPGLKKASAANLLHHGAWSDVEPGHVFTREGERVDDLVYVASGTVGITVEGKTVGRVEGGSLIGEVGVATGETATATTTALTPVRCLAFNADRLYDFLDGHADIQDAVELAIERNLRDKLRRANQRAARGSEAPDADPAVSSPG